jgi:D-amino-acid dehydrogenase
MELSGHSDNILPKRVMALYNAFKKYYPAMNIPEPDVTKAWFGYRPVTPDGLPYIGRHSKYANLTYAGGHAMLGVSLAAATGKIVDEIISHGKLSLPIQPFNPERFG